MTRCLNCGAERAADQCESCGLTSEAASVLLRRSLVMRTGVFLLGALAFLAAGYRYPPLELDGMLIFCGVLFFVGLALVVWAERRALRRAEVEMPKRIFYGLVPVPWLLAALLFVNGRFDSAPPVSWRSAVVGKFAMSALMPSRRLVVFSWRDGRKFERLAVNRDEFSRFREGDQVIVRVHEGLVGIPWVDGVSSR